MYSIIALACCVAVAYAVPTVGAGGESEGFIAEQFCKQFPSLHLCRLHDDLQGSLIELQYLLQDADVNTNEVSGPMSKRKSAFVRFGKRSAGDEVMESMEKRKSAFVRFGRSMPVAMDEVPEKRKSNYVRFG